MSIREILRKHRPKVVPVDLAGDTVYVRAMSGEARAKYMEMAKDTVPPSFKIAALGLCEESGALCFDANNPHHLEELREVDGADLQMIVNALFEASGLSNSSQDDAEKKSEASPSESGGTAVLANSTAP